MRLQKADQESVTTGRKPSFVLEISKLMRHLDGGLCVCVCVFIQSLPPIWRQVYLVSRQGRQ